MHALCRYGGDANDVVCIRPVSGRYEYPADMDWSVPSMEQMNRKVIDSVNERVGPDNLLHLLGGFTYRLPRNQAELLWAVILEPLQRGRAPL